MQARHGIVGAALVAVLVLGACAGPGEPRLMNTSSDRTGPDEFAILPTLPLEIPRDLTSLPAPTPGGTNRTDPQPRADAIAALGGNPAALQSTTIPATDNALVAHARRFGVTDGIRQILAAEDLAFRQANAGLLFERLFNVNVYFRAYRPMALDRYAEFERWRQAGVRTPAPPPNIAPTP